MKLPILVYHRIDRIPPRARYPRSYVSPERFDAQLRWLRARGYRSISFEDYLAYRRGAARLPRRPIILTFDDGYRSTREIALPLLARHGFTGTTFVVADLVGKTNVWDPDEIQEPLLDAGDIRALSAAGMSFGSHTLRHARLTQLSPEAALADLRASRGRLEGLLGRPVVVLCYPYGEHTEDTRRLAVGITQDRKSTRLNSSHLVISYAVFCLKKKKQKARPQSTSPGPPRQKAWSPTSWKLGTLNRIRSESAVTRFRHLQTASLHARVEFDVRA